MYAQQTICLTLACLPAIFAIANKEQDLKVPALNLLLCAAAGGDAAERQGEEGGCGGAAGREPAAPRRRIRRPGAGHEAAPCRETHPQEQAQGTALPLPGSDSLESKGLGLVPSDIKGVGLYRINSIGLVLLHATKYNSTPQDPGTTGSTA